MFLAACSQQAVQDAPDFSQEDWHYWSIAQGGGLVDAVLVDEGGALEVKAQQRDGKLFLQGDIMMGQQDDFGTQAAIVTSRLWPNGIVPYTIRSDVPSQTRAAIQDAVNFFNTNTNVRWVQYSGQRDYVEFFPGSGCWSYVGRNGGKQQISLGQGCGYSSVAQHEMGHAIGFHHEQSRTDRNDYVRLDCDVINCNDINWKVISEANPFGAYDYYSIMHYRAFYGGRQVIFPLDGSIDPSRIGTSSSLTSIDIRAANYLYPDGSTDPDPEPEPEPGDLYTGSLSGAGDYDIQPNGNYYYSNSGTHRGTLSGPGNADFDLRLWRWSGSRWYNVASSLSSDSSESINYNGRSGYYLWQVLSDRGSGSYEIRIVTP